MAEDLYDGAFDGVEKLTTREREILKLFSQGLQNKVVAAELSIAEETVKSHAKSIYRKLRVRNRTGASTLFAKHSQPASPVCSPVDSPKPRVTPKGLPRTGDSGRPGF
ncbi:MAG: response regulator transcription factor [Armatimonadetes bacterium]|nr:response regulator transcription factor [Armatimonadota bacterium]